ncbi:hypothetical protein [Legionella gresilensis]|uniref:hypothetical protein n=1 Tax=Legionella gresilensis TaxID=91823 RepID=UPI0010419A3E|nr:hypothetical protein [Legionella gresilensis]
MENTQLALIISKKDQKTGNCSVANSNISWHFQLAANYMQNNPSKTFGEAYEATGDEYKKCDLEIEWEHLNTF